MYLLKNLFDFIYSFTIFSQYKNELKPDSIFESKNSQFIIQNSQKIKQELTISFPLESELKIISDFEGPHDVYLKFPEQVIPDLYSLNNSIKYGYFSSENILKFYLEDKKTFKIKIVKYIQPVFTLEANIDRGLLLLSPRVIKPGDAIIYVGNEILDDYMLPDVSFPFKAFIFIAISTFFILNSYVSATLRKFNRKDKKNE